MNDFHVAARVGPKLEAPAAIMTRSFTLYPAETHTKYEFYMQICESPIEDHHA
jgi:hypothetical protein